MKDIWLIFFSIICTTTAQLLIRAAMTKIGSVTSANGLLSALPAMLTSLQLWAAIALYGLSLITWIMALSRFEVGFAYSFFAGSFALVAILGWWLLGESLSPLRIVGIVLICVGIAMVAKS